MRYWLGYRWAVSTTWLVALELLLALNVLLTLYSLLEWFDVVDWGWFGQSRRPLRRVEGFGPYIGASARQG